METKDIAYIKKNYLPRISDKTIERALKLSGAVLLKGAKWSGKTWSGAFFSNTVIDFQDENVGNSNKETIVLQPSTLLNQQKPILIDEWQEEERVWDIIRKRVDFSNKNGEYILTGSITPSKFKDDKKQKKHSGAGRIKQIELRPCSYMEMYEQPEYVSITDLLKNKRFTYGYQSKLKLTDIIDLVIKGGWPKNITLSPIDSRFILEGYIDSIVGDDSLKYRNVRIDSNTIKAILSSWTRNICTYAEINTLYNDTLNSLNKTISKPAFRTYLQVLKDMYVLDEILPWNPNWRSKARLREKTKIIFVDPAIGCARIKATSDKFLQDLKYFGFFFENLVIRDLKTYGLNSDFDVYQYRDNSGLEIDAVLEFFNNDYALIEVKLGYDKVDEAIYNINRFKEKASKANFKQPIFSAVIVGTKGVFQKKDGVYIIPFEMLRI